MTNTVRLYLRYIGVSVRSQMQYRVSFVMETMGMVGVTGVDLVVLLVLFSRFQTLEGWSLPEVAFLYGLVSLGFTFADTVSRGFDTFGVTIRLGDFDRLLLRPRSTALQLAGQELELRRMGRLVLGLGVILWASTTLDVEWNAAKVALTIVTVLCGAALFSGLMILHATLAFWTTETLEMTNIVTHGGVQATQYPTLDLPPVVPLHLHIHRSPWHCQLLPGPCHPWQARPPGHGPLVPVRGAGDRVSLPTGLPSHMGVRRSPLRVHGELTHSRAASRGARLRLFYGVQVDVAGRDCLEGVDVQGVLGYSDAVAE